MLELADEIKDISIRTEYLEFCASKITSFTYFDEYLDMKEKIKNEIVKKYLNHIPSLKQEIRDEKINKILK